MPPTRNFVRYRLEVPVTFSWKDKRGVRQQEKGYARDLSAGGAYLLAPSCPPVGTPFEFEAFLPPLDQAARTLRMQGEGKVLRIDGAVEVEGQEWKGFAAVSGSFALWDTERKFLRYRVGTPVIFSWQDERGQRRRAKGFARDLSAGGAYLLARACPPVGTPIRFEAFLPPVGPEAPTLRMQGQGRVLRVDSPTKSNGGGRGDGFAAVNESVVLQDME
jgi:hypothetical protein